MKLDFDVNVYVGLGSAPRPFLMIFRLRSAKVWPYGLPPPNWVCLGRKLLELLRLCFGSRSLNAENE